MSGMKKQCKGCYAADTGMHPLSGEVHGCKLSYKTDGNGHPQEDCPKPTSWAKLRKLIKKWGDILDITIDDFICGL